MIRELKNNRFFSIIGAQRSGTTFLYTVLDQHPEISMNKPVRPEPKFFLSPDFDSSTVDDYVESYFPKHDYSMLYGEKSTSYLEYGHLAHKIDHFLPGCKILVVLRNPVDRAISNYSFSKDNKIDLRPAEIALDISNENQISVPKHLSVSPYSYISRGIYIDFLEPYINAFQSRMKVVLFEDLVGNIKTLHNIYKFLEVSDSFVPIDVIEKHNTSTSIQISDELRNTLNSFYDPWNKRLESKLGISLRAWKQ